MHVGTHAHELRIDQRTGERRKGYCTQIDVGSGALDRTDGWSPVIQNVGMVRSRQDLVAQAIHL